MMWWFMERFDRQKERPQSPVKRCGLKKPDASHTWSDLAPNFNTMIIQGHMTNPSSNPKPNPGHMTNPRLSQNLTQGI
jgi:hypothetical protein